MSIKVTNDFVQIVLGVDTRTMTVAQYALHNRDPGFDAAMKVGAAAADKADLDDALTAAADAKILAAQK